MIEKRYHTNLNCKIATLYDNVLSLRVIGKDNPYSEDLQEDLQSLSPARKLNKVFILIPYPLSSILPTLSFPAPK